MSGRLTPERALALAGLAALFVVGLICLILILGAGGDDEPVQSAAPDATATPTPTPTPEPTPTPTPTPPPLTPEQLAQRDAAGQQVRAQGYVPVTLRDYDPAATLRVVLGEPTAATQAAGVAAGRRAFFFVGDGFIGTDASETSDELEITRQTANSVTLAYGLTTGETDRVRFVWDGSSLTPRGEIPAVDLRRG